MWPLCDKQNVVAKASERSYWSRNNVSERSWNQVGRELSFEHEQKSACDWFVARRFYWSPRGLQAFLAVRQSVSSGQLWELVATPWWPICDWSAMTRRSPCTSLATARRLVAKWFPSMRRPFAIGFAIHYWPVCALQHHFVTRIQITHQHMYHFNLAMVRRAGKKTKETSHQQKLCLRPLLLCTGMLRQSWRTTL